MRHVLKVSYTFPRPIKEKIKTIGRTLDYATHLPSGVKHFQCYKKAVPRGIFRKFHMRFLIQMISLIFQRVQTRFVSTRFVSTRFVSTSFVSKKKNLFREHSFREHTKKNSFREHLFREQRQKTRFVKLVS